MPFERQPAALTARSGRRRFQTMLGATALAAVVSLAGQSTAADNDYPFDLTVENALAGVGEPTAIIARITVHDGYKVLKSYRNRIIELSSLDDTVEFERPVVRGAVNGEDGILFSVAVTPIAAGEHPINGVFRIGYHNGETMRMVSVPLMATVTGRE